jgi:hypothetical protein
MQDHLPHRGAWLRLSALIITLALVTVGTAAASHANAPHAHDSVSEARGAAEATFTSDRIALYIRLMRQLPTASRRPPARRRAAQLGRKWGALQRAARYDIRGLEDAKAGHSASQTARECYLTALRTIRSGAVAGVRAYIAATSRRVGLYRREIGRTRLARKGLRDLRSCPSPSPIAAPGASTSPPSGPGATPAAPGNPGHPTVIGPPNGEPPIVVEPARPTPPDDPEVIASGEVSEVPPTFQTCHGMTTRAILIRRSGELSGSTHIWSRGACGGFTGGLDIDILDAAGNALSTIQVGRWGVGGVVFDGPRERHEQWGPLAVANQTVLRLARQLKIRHYWAPKA